MRRLFKTTTEPLEGKRQNNLRHSPETKPSWIRLPSKGETNKGLLFQLKGLIRAFRKGPPVVAIHMGFVKTVAQTLFRLLGTFIQKQSPLGLDYTQKRKATGPPRSTTEAS